MIVIRPVTTNDLPDLQRLAREAGSGMTSLPDKREHLESKLTSSVESFARDVREPDEESYWLVMEDTLRGQVIGSTAIIANVGLSRPFYSYKILQLAHTSRELDKYKPMKVLQVVNEYRGASEIGSLYLTPEYRKHRNGRLLSLCRFLFMAEFRQRFSDTVIAEIRGVQDSKGRSPFWDSLGRHFFDMDFSSADFLSSLGHYQFVADLMPKHPVYVCLLPPRAQAVIGIPHKASRPALEMLMREGFRFDNCVDIFDAGPTLSCPVDHIRTARDSRRTMVGKVAKTLDSELYMISSVHPNDFRICRGNLRVHENGIVDITRQVADALDLQPGDKIRYIRL
jgi:arginine N-succinyltransferase